MAPGSEWVGLAFGVLIFLLTLVVMVIGAILWFAGERRLGVTLAAGGGGAFLGFLLFSFITIVWSVGSHPPWQRRGQTIVSDPARFMHDEGYRRELEKKEKGSPTPPMIALLPIVGLVLGGAIGIVRGQREPLRSNQAMQLTPSRTESTSADD